MEAIARAEEAGFDVGEDLLLTSRQEFAEAEFDLKLAEAQRLAAEIRTTATSLAQADAGVAAAVTAAVATFEGVSFPEMSASSDPPRDSTVQPVNNEIPKDEPQPAAESELKPESEAGQPEAETPKTWQDLLVPGDASDAPYLAQIGVEDTAALLETSESTGGHLIERHVAQSPADLAARLEARPGLQTVSSFASIDEASSVVGEALQKNRAAVDSWLADGMLDTLILETSFKGGSVLSRGAEVVPATEARVVLMNNGAGGWYVLTGYPLP